jgi:hypothetical protein
MVLRGVLIHRVQLPVRHWPTTHPRTAFIQFRFAAQLKTQGPDRCTPLRADSYGQQDIVARII